MQPGIYARLSPAFALLFVAGCGRTAAVAPPLAAPPAPAPPPAFREAAREAGIRYRWTPPGKSPLNIRQSIGNGCAFFDYDGDGNLDALLVGSPPALYRGDGRGRFRDVSAETGVGALRGEFLGCAVGDYDNDGRADVYLSAYRGGALLHNEGGRAFRDAGRACGIPPQPWGTACLFADLDGDGLLDLFVGNYVRFGPKTEPQLCRGSSGILTSCGPREYPPEPGRVYRNLDRGRFRDVTKAWGFGALAGKALGVAAADYDGSGRVSLAVANDEVAGDLMRLEKGRFRNAAPALGTAYDASGGVHGGMGTDWGDVDGDGRLDLFVATFRHEAKSLYRQEADGLFTDRSRALGLDPALPYVAFGAKLFDFDNDGWPDLLIANGHINDNIAEIDRAASYRQPTQLFRNEGGRRFVEATALLDAAARRPLVGRGLAVGDYDNDGRVDALVVDGDGEPLLLHNETNPAGNWIGLRLRLPRAGGRDACGAVVTVEAGGRKILRHCRADGSYLSSSDPRVHVGLGAAGRAERVTVRWPDGKVEAWRGLSANSYHTLERGHSVPR